MAKRARNAQRRGRLSREQILAAALAIADAEGIDALTMRRIGERIGAEAMSIYRHVRDKEDILDGLVDLVYAEIDLPPRTTPWKRAMRDRAISAREVLSRHPWAIALMESRMHPGPANLRHHDAVVAILRDAGFTSVTATHAYNLLDSYIYGFALQEKSLPITAPDELAKVGDEILRRIPADTYPDLVAVATDLLRSGFDYGKEFEVGLDLVLDAIDRGLARGASTGRAGAGRARRGASRPRGSSRAP